MHSIEVPAEVSAALDAQDAGDAAIRGLNFDTLSPIVRLRVLERMEASHRRRIAASHDVIASLAKEEPADVGGPAYKVIADRLRISYAETRRRVRDAQQLSARVTLTGQELPPELPATATVWREGRLDAQHLRVIQAFVRDLPDATPADAVEDAERFLAEQATKLRPDQLERAAHRIALHINPDGKFSDSDRARQRGFAWCGQRSDGMSIGKLVASPELRANLDAWFARFAAPGVCNPDDEYPCTTDEPAEDLVSHDARTPGQRQHDALNALVRGQLGDPKLGQHNGLPVSVIVSTTLQELRTGAGRAVTGGGTLLPMRDLIRMASHAYHYLAVFDEHQSRPLYLGRSRRVATSDQRVVLYAKDRGCTHPGCDAPGYWCEVHHVDEWAAGGTTDVDNLTFACRPHHKLAGAGWRTRKLANGNTEWIPPPQFDLGARTNDYHHPERLAGNDEAGSG
ncbi:HNH endonuclease signature motif containing protein [Mycobacterium stomatepiae]|uniref:HNH nuclease domain-containing protein n=1 Tax=Mycobacterium stomatepiae TaxID=470076 RepID=A0A7I7Q5C0_9MYCO|nr:HNH endonuclease signature motif containing protein [Mycobacterium stomatepiae]MCV7163411.1 HNH endonuclease [Mycobacterium stomatepiae]BBY21439.1 hypothetical protein MSTO_16440 [Mycobacterium stomatepiae]